MAEGPSKVVLHFDALQASLLQRFHWLFQLNWFLYVEHNMDWDVNSYAKSDEYEMLIYNFPPHFFILILFFLFFI